ncbi:hypothetical protein R3Q08_26905 [Rhodococcus erythropolis]|uniref:hypothetical protein n=1 Tax=Rhodococcus erythropolis TaxID=1833 RepID=UPI002949A712|nr:hypothetical protein [Rhodococcus erythropolis]MDV6211895.1 hypothetical protein [Rhodococcus erythropolis]
MEAGIFEAVFDGVGGWPNTAPATNSTPNAETIVIVRLVREYSTHRRIGARTGLAALEDIS